MRAHLPAPPYREGYMLVRIMEKNPGCVFEIGQLLRMGDREGQHIIDEGYAEEVPESAVQKPPEDKRRVVRSAPKGPSPYMIPPRHICGCGFVASDAASLAEHKKGC